MGLEEAKKRLEEAGRIAVLTGAGISKPSGIPTFRDAEGLWKAFSPWLRLSLRMGAVEGMKALGLL